MSLLSAVTSEKIVGPQINVIAGDNGVGKTTLVASTPNVLILDLENGSKHIAFPAGSSRLSADKFPTFLVFKDTLKELIETNHSYKNIGIDSAEALETLINRFVCQDEQVETIGEVPFGNGYLRARELITDVMHDLQALQRKGIASWIVAHTQIKSKTDPAMNQTYDRVIMRCSDKMASVIRDLSDNIFYATYKVHTVQKSESSKAKAYGDGQRVMFTAWRPGFDAKNRLDLPLELPLSYDALVEACAAPAVSDEDVLKDITEMAVGLDASMKLKVEENIKKFKNNPVKLRELKNRLMKAVS